jgi:hypothetical protein
MKLLLEPYALFRTASVLGRIASDSAKVPSSAIEPGLSTKSTVAADRCVR